MISKLILNKYNAGKPRNEYTDKENENYGTLRVSDGRRLERQQVYSERPCRSSSAHDTGVRLSLLFDRRRSIVLCAVFPLAAFRSSIVSSVEFGVDVMI